MVRRHRYVAPTPRFNYVQLYTCVVCAVIASVVVVAIVHHFLQGSEATSRKLLIDFRHCRIPEVEPTHAKKLKVKRTTLPDCQNPGFLSSITSTLSENDPICLNYLPDVLPSYKASEAVCCFHEISRMPGDDSDIKISKNCQPFDGKYVLNSDIEHVYVKCTEGDTLIYQMMHGIVGNKKEFVKRRKKIKMDEERAFKILLIGFDNMSALNFKRSLYELRNTIKNETGWYEFKAHTSIGQSSFANAFAMLTGQSPTQKYKNCNPRDGGFLDNCQFIWKDFEKAGYITAYVEDQISISTFNVHHKGFNKKPTDFYFRPYFIATERYIPATKLGNLSFCVAQVPYMDNIFILTQKITFILENSPYFGYIYTNSMSSRQLLTAIRMGKRLVGGVHNPLLNNTKEAIVIYFSDTGTRLETGPDGFYEDRHPILYIKLPPRFQQLYPDLTANLKENTGKVTSPYDLHITLRHFLNLSVGKKLNLGAVGCNGCQSLLQKISATRRCSEAGIPDDSCTCSLKDIDKSKVMINKVARFGLAELNRKLATRKTKKGGKCSLLQLNSVTSSRTQLLSPSKLLFIVSFTVENSKAHFEVVARKKLSSVLSAEPQLELISEIVNMNVDVAPEICKAKKKSKPGAVDKRSPNEDEEKNDEEYSEGFLSDFDPHLYGLDQV